MLSKRLIRNILKKTVTVETVTNKHHGQNAFINHFGKRTRPRPASATVITTGSQMSPRKAFGKPNKLDCQEIPTLPQDTTALRLQESGALTFFARAIASIERTSEAERLSNEEINIVMYALKWRMPAVAVSTAREAGAEESGLSICDKGTSNLRGRQISRLAFAHSKGKS